MKANHQNFLDFLSLNSYNDNDLTETKNNVVEVKNNKTL